MSASDIRDAVERQAKAVTLRPSIGQNTAVTRVRLRDGLTCDIEEGAWQLVASMSPKFGGANDGPNPGVFGRAALGSCLAIGYAIWAARLGVAVDALDVEVHADYDARGELGVSDVRTGRISTLLSYASGDEAAEAAFGRPGIGFLASS